MLSIAPAFATALALAARGETLLYEAFFTTGTLRLNTWGIDLDIAGNTWLGRGQLVEVGSTTEGEDGGRQQFKISLAGVQLANVGLAMGDPAIYRGREIRIYTCPLSIHGVALEAPVLRVLGFMNKVAILPDGSEDGNSLKVDLDCYANRIGTLIDASGFRVNNTTHQAQYPGELGLERAHEINTKPQVWLTARAQQI